VPTGSHPEKVRFRPGEGADKAAMSLVLLTNASQYTFTGDWPRLIGTSFLVAQR